MDAHALLTSQGWRGSGHSLHPSSDTTGLRKPILVARKQNVLGIGKKQHHTSDLWWQNAFDSSLKGLDTSQQGKVVQTVTNGGLDMAMKGGGRFVGSGGLYACFVRGESLNGTLTPEEEEAVKESVVENAIMKSVVIEHGQKKSKIKREGESEVERRARKAEKAEKAARRALREQQSTSVLAVFDAETQDVVVEPTTGGGSKTSETAAEKKERKRQKKLLRGAEAEGVETPSVEEQRPKKKRKKAGAS